MNTDYKRVVQTTPTTQATVMCMRPQAAIGSEVHADYAQIVCVVAGNGLVVVDGLLTAVGPGSVVLIPGGAQHDVRNTHPTHVLRLVVLYSPPKFPPDMVIKQSEM